MHYFEIILNIIVLVLVWLYLKNLPSEWMLVRKLKNGDPLPERIEDFPIRETSLQDYLTLKSKIDSFIEMVDLRLSSTISLSDSDINHICLRGNMIDKYRFVSENNYILENEFFDFEIKNKKIIMKHLKYPKFLNYEKGILTAAYLISYKNEDGLNLETKAMVEFNTRDLNELYNKYRFFRNILNTDTTKTREISESSLLFCIFGFSEHLDRDPIDRSGYISDNIKYERGREIVSKIHSVEIIDDQLVISAFF